MTALYDTIGVDYTNLRKPDPRIAAQVDAALGNAQTVLNVGAGAGSYEPTSRQVTALEPSAEMIAQRPKVPHQSSRVRRKSCRSTTTASMRLWRS